MVCLLIAGLLIVGILIVCIVMVCLLTLRAYLDMSVMLVVCAWLMKYKLDLAALAHTFGRLRCKVSHHTNV